MGVSRITIYNRVKKGQIPAEMVGKTFRITDNTVNNILNSKMTKSHKDLIDRAIRKTIEDYGEVLKKLSRE